MTENNEQSKVEKLRFSPISEEVEHSIINFLENRRNKTFSQRNPQLGKMINCAVCARRHRGSIKCEQKYAYLYTLEDEQTGEKTKVFATATPYGERPTYKQMLGAAMFKGKRRKPHPNTKNLQLIERTHALYGNAEFNPDSKEDHADMKIARATASRQLRKQRRLRSNRRIDQQHLSRRINRGTAASGSRI